jgi:AcrR family transcriptional regulator
MLSPRSTERQSLRCAHICGVTHAPVLSDEPAQSKGSLIQGLFNSVILRRRNRQSRGAAGIAAPALYRIFGDKSGLLRALVDHGFDRYLSIKRAATPSADPVEDLRNGWDSHVAFAIAHPAVYRLMYSPALGDIPRAAADALALLRAVLDRCAAAGRLRLDPELAAQIIMSANIGVALSIVSQPDNYPGPELSTRVRDAVHAVVLTGERVSATAPSTRAPAKNREAIAIAAAQLAALLRASAAATDNDNDDTTLTQPESALLQQWCTQLADG